MTTVWPGESDLNQTRSAELTSEEQSEAIDVGGEIVGPAGGGTGVEPPVNEVASGTVGGTGSLEGGLELVDVELGADVELGDLEHAAPTKMIAMSSRESLNPFLHRREFTKARLS